ncbi:MAG: A/G-specific adenine glycosylase [Myxococcota bacterium]
MSDTSPTKPAKPATLRRAILAWYHANRRDLPWRRTDDAYAIWISEAMLQQTRVETVIPYWERFLARVPDPTALATADVDDVLGLWAGLGYYSRARNLHRAAQEIVERHGGNVPDDVDDLLALPGVGRYTAGAVASIAFDKPAPLVDGNVERVLTRLYGIDGEVKSVPVQRRLWDEAAALVEGEEPGALNQALMELGATLCTPRAPRCLACPWTKHCRAHAEGREEALPVKKRARAAKRVAAAGVWLERDGKVLAVQRPKEGLLGGLWELPGGDLDAKEDPVAGLARQLEARLGIEARDVAAVGSVEHLFTHRRLTLHVFRATAPPGRIRRVGWDAHRWVSSTGFEGLALGGPTRKALELLAGAP